MKRPPHSRYVAPLLILAAWSTVALCTVARAAHTLETPELRLTLDDSARLTELIDRRSGHNYAGGGQLWRMFIERGQRFQEEVVAPAGKPRITTTTGEIRVEYAEVNSRTFGVLPVKLSFGVRLQGDEAHWWSEVSNGTADAIVKELQFPLVGGLNLQRDQGLVTTAYGGQRYADPKQIIREAHPLTRHWYQNADHQSLQVQYVYPGFQAANNCFAFPGKDAGLYFGSHDATFRNTLHLWRLYPDDKLETGFVKHLFTRAGENIRFDGFVISPYQGTWHVAADKYGRWAKTWFKPLPRPDWMRGYNGWQRLILKHQNGDILFPYNSFAQIFADGAKAGVKSLFMFAWHPGGHDRMYPDYVADPEMGGEEGLRAGIKKFQDELGGSVILYASGRLVDRQSKFFEEKGRKIAIKTRSGAEARDAYLFGNAGTYERLYGSVELTPMCLDVPEWVAVLKGVIDKAGSYGCKAVFFDQLGLQESPCWDKSHGHFVPYVTQTQGKRRVIQELRDYTRARYPGMAFGVEVFADAVGEYFDFAHGLYHQGYLARNPDYQQKGERPRYPGFIEWTRYLFPDVMISDRDIRDGVDVERRVNYALLVGMINDVEIYRCRATIAEIPHYQAWLGQVNTFRDRHLDLLAIGNYRDTLGFTLDSQDVDARAYVHGDTIGVMLTQSHLATAATKLRVPAANFVSSDGFGGATVQRDVNHVVVTLPRHAVALALFKRQR